MSEQIHIDDCTDMLIEVFEIFFNHILYVRDVYPPQIFKKRRAYNTPIFVSIFPPLNLYLYKVLLSARELLRNGELLRLEILLYRNELEIYERYNFFLSKDVPSLMEARARHDDEFLIDFEEQLRSSLHTLAERLKTLDKLPPDVKFKVLLHTTQAGFVKFSHNSQYQDFPWIHENIESQADKKISLLPLTTINAFGIEVMTEVF